MTKPSRYDADPEALAWARAHVQEFIDRLADFEQQAKSKSDSITEYGCRVARAMAERHFLGDDGCTIGAFDERRRPTATVPERPVGGEENTP